MRAAIETPLASRSAVFFLKYVGGGENHSMCSIDAVPLDADGTVDEKNKYALCTSRKKNIASRKINAWYALYLLPIFSFNVALLLVFLCPSQRAVLA